MRGTRDFHSSFRIKRGRDWPCFFCILLVHDEKKNDNFCRFHLLVFTCCTELIPSHTYVQKLFYHIKRYNALYNVHFLKIYICRKQNLKKLKSLAKDIRYSVGAAGGAELILACRLVRGDTMLSI